MSSKTMDNLKEAFSGESQANRKYLAFSKKAEDDGHTQVAKLFRAAAESETVHALNHLRITETVSSTEDNLKAAINGETFEFEKMYPQMIETAEKEGQDAAKNSFYFANKVEMEHAKLFQEALENLPSIKSADYWVCQGCGHVHLNEAPNSCPVCGAPKKMFKRIE